MAIKLRHFRPKQIAAFLLEKPVDIASLAAFRALFGAVMTFAMIRFLAKGWVRELYTAPVFHFTYPAFDWVRPWPDTLMHAHFILLALLAIGVAIGFYYRVCIALFFVGFTYIELLDQTAYLNHYYLVSLLSGLMIFLPANRAWSVDAWREPQIRVDAAPAWCLNILRFQVGVVYFFAGLAKVNADWLLRAEPLRIWLAARSDLPVIGSFLNEAWVSYAASWCGAAFDLSIVAFLLWKPTRRPAYALVLIFHVATWVLFNIGMFPWIMIAAATIFFAPDWPRRSLARWRGILSKTESGKSVGHPVLRVLPYPRISLIAGPLGLYVAVQLALPLRPYFCSQPSAWTWSGFNCAWQVMIVEKTGYAEFYAFDPLTDKRTRIALSSYLTPRQQVMMAQDPDLIRAMAKRLAKDFQARGMNDVQIEVDSFASLNGRPSQRLISPGLDLASPPSSHWIVPLVQK